MCLGVQRDGVGSEMFAGGATDFNQPLDFDTSRVTDMRYVASFAAVCHVKP